jgi:DNA-binding PadR family transcriptional regulator
MEDYMYLLNPDPSADLRLDPMMIRFWGKPFSDWDFQVCKALRWIAAQGKGAEVSWRPTDKIKAFKGQIYKRGKPVTFRCDDALREFMCSNALTCLDPYFGKSAKELHLRVLLTLVNLVFLGHARYIVADREIIFAATHDLAPPLSASAVDEELRALSREGLIVSVLDEEGKLRWTLTPKGLWFERSDDDPGGDLRNVLIRLEKEGLACRTMDQRGVKYWSPTKEGVRRGLASTTISLTQLLVELGLDPTSDQDKIA